MGGLRKYMPITFWTMPDRHAGAGRHAVLRRLLLEGHDHRGRRRACARGAQLGRRVRATTRVLLGAFVTAFYSFRLMYLTFHGAAALARQARGRLRGAGSGFGRARTTRTIATHEHEHGDDGHHAARAARIAVGGDGAADPAGDPVDRDRLPDRRPDAVRHRRARPCEAVAVLPRRDRRACGARRDRQAGARNSTVRSHSRCMASWRRRSGWRSPASRWPRCMYWWKPELPAQGAQRCSPGRCACSSDKYWHGHAMDRWLCRWRRRAGQGCRAPATRK